MRRYEVQMEGRAGAQPRRTGAAEGGGAERQSGAIGPRAGRPEAVQGLRRAQLLYIPDVEELVRRVAQSRGRVLLRLPDRTLCDARANLARLRDAARRGCGVELYLSDGGDYLRFVELMIYAHMGERGA